MVWKAASRIGYVSWKSSDEKIMDGFLAQEVIFKGSGQQSYTDIGFGKSDKGRGKSPLRRVCFVPLNNKSFVLAKTNKLSTIRTRSIEQ